MSVHAGAPRIVMATLRWLGAAVEWVYAGVAVSPGMGGEGHSVAQGWIDTNFVLKAQRVVDVRRAQATMLADAELHLRRAMDRVPVVRVCDCAQCRAVADARRIELWKPILHADAHLRAKSSMHAYNSAAAMVN